MVHYTFMGWVVDWVVCTGVTMDAVKAAHMHRAHICVLHHWQWSRPLGCFIQVLCRFYGEKSWHSHSNSHFSCNCCTCYTGFGLMNSMCSTIKLGQPWALEHTCLEEDYSLTWKKKKDSTVVSSNLFFSKNSIFRKQGCVQWVRIACWVSLAVHVRVFPCDCHCGSHDLSQFPT